MNTGITNTSIDFCAAVAVSTLIAIAPLQAEQQTQPSVIVPSDNSAKVVLTDETFVRKAALISLRDVELATLASQKSTNPKIKEFAQRVSTSSAATLDKLKRIATRQRLQVPQQLDAEYRLMVQQLQNLSGRAFDDAFVEVMRKGQDTTVGLYDNAAGHQDVTSKVRSFAHDELAELRKNQQLAHALMQTTPEATR